MQNTPGFASGPMLRFYRGNISRKSRKILHSTIHEFVCKLNSEENISTLGDIFYDIKIM